MVIIVMTFAAIFLLVAALCFATCLMALALDLFVMFLAGHLNDLGGLAALGTCLYRLAYSVGRGNELHAGRGGK